ncbi:hypothetical protein FGG08_006257 [Glutinoglossum americanum]|uniref:Uncharacterized protein n=1 Tax=Glutinoglossum americanum TaxID=1670608 RepID=A0A9P8HYQ9_9PEZI|nr:hypothetical protein FGG08_006257 [Glutinoglossum americanum]
MHWIWTCHRCNATYPLGVTRRCLNDGHYFCQRIPKIGRSGRVRHYKSCRNEFDFTGWSLRAEWRRDRYPDNCADREQRDCSNFCDYPSHCRWGDVADVKSKNHQVQIKLEDVATKSEKDSASVEREVSGNVCDAAQESLIASKTKLSVFKEEFGWASQASDRDKYESPQDGLSPSDDSMDEAPGCCESNMDDGDDDRPPGAGATTITAANDGNSTGPIAPTTPLAPLSPAVDFNPLSLSTSRTGFPNSPDVTPRVEFQSSGEAFQDFGRVIRDLPVPPSEAPSDGRISQDSGYRSNVSEGTCDGENLFDVDWN